MLLPAPVKINQAASHRQNVVSTPGFATKSTPSNIRYLLAHVLCVFRWHCSTWVKELIGQEEYQATGAYDDVRFERHVRGQLRKVAKMAKANEGFEKTLHYQ
ncbi:hypothetical protein [Sphingobium sp. KCTC 72723]|uniref:hypothetical protein n=1 Tax=Sphingobium sp. KCTC 72723 TaxID=2733867 RepID=UPI00165DC5B2|nr:hypothetical protein [Sphingobium sp. KCTC 72723]